MWFRKRKTPVEDDESNDKKKLVDIHLKALRNQAQQKDTSAYTVEEISSDHLTERQKAIINRFCVSDLKLEEIDSSEWNT